MAEARRPTQADVARLAGVSRGTVSVVLNDRRDGPIQVSEETRQRILAAAQNLGYAPNPAAQMLAQGSNRLLAIFCYGGAFPVERDSPLYSHMMGVERQAIAQDYNLLLVTRGQNNHAQSIYATGTNMLRLADGAILMGSSPDPSELCRLSEEGYPFVCIGRKEPPGCQVRWIGSDYVAAGFKTTRHLLEFGHRRLGLVCVGPYREEIQDRVQGCREALSGTLDACLTIVPSGGLESAESLSAILRDGGITALMCGGMASLRQTTPLLQALEIRIPDDLSVSALAFDEGRLWPFQSLRPTYVRHQDDKAGEGAVRMLADVLADPSLPIEQIRLPVDLVIGNTTAPAKG